MTYYVTPVENLATYLVNTITPLTTNIIRFDSAEIFGTQFNHPIQVIFRTISSNANPKYARDEWVIAIQVLGRDKSQKLKASDMLWDITNTLNGMDGLNIDNKTIFHTICTNQPTFIGFNDNTMPLYSAQFRFHVEYDNTVGNREPYV